ncbi:hypothetical protein [Streptomyces sp. 35G-GA-8]|uniref:hypothetical protein n=1 Tax=Streptomyces sp. 35G-GA-8 TaxID=2939434 RepID=UPI00201FAC5A|nr:hypothetical protein [Streptomyces sp. 35G-GA-8]MCL7379915.1 hypothetical protein [Streptomyces sp. 35G-GA-8]
MIDRLLLLYPRGYRAAYGPEIADTYREMTVGVARWGRLREGADLAAHALRVRFGLGSADPLGRLVASAAPFALAAAGVSGGIRLARWYAGITASPTPWRVQFRIMDAAEVFGLLFLLLVCAGAIVALTGRWAAGVAAAVFGLAGTAVLALSEAHPNEYQYRIVVPVAAVLTIAVILACPPDLRPEPSTSAVAGVMAGAAWLPAIVVERGVVGWMSTDYGGWPLLVLAATGIALALRARSSGLRESGAMAMASPPLLADACLLNWYDPRPFAVLLLVLPAAALLTSVAGRVRRPR